MPFGGNFQFIDNNSYVYYQINSSNLTIKFKGTIASSTLVNDNFQLFKLSDDATPVLEQVADAFLEIDLLKDYDSLSRLIRLWWNDSLEPLETYRVVVSGITTVTGLDLHDLIIDFETPSVIGDPQKNRVTREPLDVEDYSIKYISASFDGSTGGNDATPNSSGELTVSKIVPESTFQIAKTENDGKISITFSERIAGNFVNSSDFKLQKKSLDAGITSWVNINTKVFAGSDGSEVAVYLPSQDLSPVYSYEVGDLSNHTFWDSGHKYRLILNPDIGN